MYQQLAIAGVRSLENYSVEEKVRKPRSVAETSR